METATCSLGYHEGGLMKLSSGRGVNICFYGKLFILQYEGAPWLKIRPV